MTETEEYQQSITDLEETMKNVLRAFAQWFEREWQYKGREEWEKAYK